MVGKGRCSVCDWVGLSWNMTLSVEGRYGRYVCPDCGSHVDGLISVPPVYNKMLYLYPGYIVSVLDGDTVKVDLLLNAEMKTKEEESYGLGIWGTPTGLRIKAQVVRLYGCNAPEKNTQAGMNSRAALRVKLPVGLAVKVVSYGWDKYGGRIVGTVGNVVEEMIQAGHAKPWDGRGPKPV